MSENQHQRMAPWKPSDTIDVYLNGNPGQWDWCLIDNLDPDDCRAIAIESIRRLDAALACVQRHADGWTAQVVRSQTGTIRRIQWQRGTSGLDDIEPMTEAEQSVMRGLTDE